MRDIRFRVWDDNYKYMNYKVIVGMWGDDVLDDENYTACSMWIEPDKVDYECEPHWCHFEPYHSNIHLMEGAGLRDINGTMIFEGDIITSSCAGHEVNGVVVKHEGCWCINTGEGCYRLLYPLGDIVEINKVIGNIYENKAN